ncbi:FadR/GntR family transcriptional regulator [Rhodococcus opacus]|uniref:FadR/GntR family transcriptional regulator n=1 Tax=Rhodococcus opacus TaxID=37919 RepID=UPI0024738F2A|nr:FCD domain-containing protein [Rhodococcus opacus]
MTPVRRSREQVEDQLRRAIIAGRLAEDSALPGEGVLAQDFNVSRATVREALRSLVQSGLLEKGAGATGSLRVKRIDHRMLARIVSDRLADVLELGSVTNEEVADFRDLLEVPSARLAAKYRTEAHLKNLRAIIDDEQAVTYDDAAVHGLNARFHVEIANAGENRVLAAFLTALHRLAHPLAFVRTDEDLGRMSVTHHIALYRAIEARDADAAAAAMGEHLGLLRRHAQATRSLPEPLSLPSPPR